jgi:FAD dependent oxidoreductase TIGR03364
MSKTAIVVGAGIVGLAAARALAADQYRVTVLEKNEKAIGASIRNFGMIWPIGQPPGDLYERAMLSRAIWKQIAAETKLWYDPAGSLHVAYSQEEWNVLQELADTMPGRKYQLLTAEQATGKSAVIVKQGLTGGLYSADEMIVDPREAMRTIPRWLEEKYRVQFLWGKTVTDISYPSVYAGREEFEADMIYVCSGADFETLYPEIFSSLPVAKCKLQMMRMTAQADRIGPALCGGLSLIHYNSFKTVTSWRVLKDKLEQEFPDYIKWGIHVMVSQHQSGELTIGDSHEYGLTPDPFDKQFINQLILDYLKKFARFKDENIVETWNGVYLKFTNGQTDLVMQPESGVTIINCLGGAGMTLGFGLCEQVVDRQ